MASPLPRSHPSAPTPPRSFIVPSSLWALSIFSASRAGGRTPPRTPRRGEGGGAHVYSGASCYVWEFFSSFLMFSKYLWRFSCIMKSTGSVVTHLIFEFSFQRVLLTRIHVQWFYCVWKCTAIFSWKLNTGSRRLVFERGWGNTIVRTREGPLRGPRLPSAGTLCKSAPKHTETTWQCRGPGRGRTLLLLPQAPETLVTPLMLNHEQ